jgi:hypothetical protein
LLSVVFFGSACQPGTDSTHLDVNVEEAGSTRSVAEPQIEALPIMENDGNYKLVSGDNVTIRIHAADAAEVELYYQPVTSDDRALLLLTVREPVDKEIFAADLRIPDDFNGEVWGRVKYPSGEVRETSHLLLAKSDESAKETNNDAPNQPSDGISSATGTDQTMDEGDESARSDQLTGGRVQKAELQPGKGDVRITVNVPAFRMTLWQGDREIKSNYVGVGRKNFPIPIGMRSADRIILNPDWVPPNSAWVRRSPNVEPYERIPADDPNNPLGKIKIPLGQAYLLHEAQGPSDIGKLVSHGCIRVMRDDLFEVSSLIARALDLPISDRQIAAAREDNDRRVIKLGEDLPVDINYDTMVVESGILTIYPDVYGKNANTVENLRAELKAFGVDMSKLNDQILGHMLDKVNSDQKFVVAIEKLKGNAFEGKVEPLIPK